MMDSSKEEWPFPKVNEFCLGQHPGTPRLEGYSIFQDNCFKKRTYNKNGKFLFKLHKKKKRREKKTFSECRPLSQHRSNILYITMKYGILKGF